MGSAPPPVRVAIIGAGIVGTNLADELVQRGWGSNITVIEFDDHKVGMTVHDDVLDHAHDH